LTIHRQIPKIAIIVSIMLLTGFLYYFLNNEFDREKSRINREVGYMFINAVKSVEGDFFNKILFSGDSLKRFKVNLSKKEGLIDSAKELTIVGKNAPYIDSSSRRMSIKIENESISQQEVSGVLSMIVDMDINSIKDNGHHHKMDRLKDVSKEYIPMIAKEFKKALDNAGLDLNYQILTDSLISSTKPGVVVASYADVGTHKKFYVKLENNFYYILGKIWRQAALSLGLLSLIIVTFYTINSHWTAQQKLSSQKNDFIQNMTHELKTPVATMSVALEAITNFDAAHDEVRRKEYIGIARNEAKRITLLVDKVLSLSIIDESEQTILVQVINADEIIKEVLSTNYSIDNPANINYENANPSVNILVDKEWIQIAIENIIDNAVKYHNENKSTINISTVIEGNDWLKILIKDNNEAIPNNLKEKIFDKFYRIPKGNLHNVKGHGLGLYYVRRMMELMQGSVSLTSNSNGNTFVLKCKIAK
jgi:signal transduction histidine kinase